MSTTKQPSATAAGPDNGPRPSRDDIEFQRQRREESSKAAKKALELRREAKRLREAAYGAGDPEERQKLLEQAINKEVEAESFGKVAKYMQSGTFQGMVAGTGIGIVPGATLGALTGTLVGGTVSLITGGIGAAGGALTGYLHGPWFTMGGAIGGGVKKVTGMGPGWKATAEQKRQIEKMVGQVKEGDMPDDTALNDMAEWGDGGGKTGEWARKAGEWIPSGGPAWSERKGANPPQSEKRSTSAKAMNGAPPTDTTRSRVQQSTQKPIQVQKQTPPKPSSPKPIPKATPASRAATPTGGERRKPRKLEVRAGDVPKEAEKKKKPKKLEVRSKA